MVYTEEQLKEIDHKLDIIAELSAIESIYSSVVMNTAIVILTMEILGYPTIDNDTFDEEFVDQLIDRTKAKLDKLLNEKSN